WPSEGSVGERLEQAVGRRSLARGIAPPPIPADDASVLTAGGRGHATTEGVNRECPPARSPCRNRRAAAGRKRKRVVPRSGRADCLHERSGRIRNLRHLFGRSRRDGR